MSREIESDNRYLADSSNSLDHVNDEVNLARASHGHRHDHGSSSHAGHHKGKHNRPVTYQDRDNAYWSKVEAAKRHDQFVTEFPPVHPGMDHPKDLNQNDGGHAPRGSQPSLNEIIAASRGLMRDAYHDKKRADFNLTRVDEDTFKQRYAREAEHIGAQYGLSKDNVQNIVRRIYAFEDGGWGTHETLSSMPQWMLDPQNEKQRYAYHSTSSAIGYNQLLLENSVTDVRSHGTEIAARLDELAKADPARATELSSKADLVRNLQSMRGMDESVKNGIHALNLDGDVGPIIQSIELENLVKYAKDNDFSTELGGIAARLMAGAAKYDALPDPNKQAAIKELMSRVEPPSDAPPTWQADKDELERRLLALPAGQSDLLARKNLSDDQYTLLNTQLLQLRKYGAEQGPLSKDAQLLVDKMDSVYFGGFTADGLMPAALEQVNLAGTGRGLAMLQHDNLPTSNFFSRAGYNANPTVARRSTGELLLQINRVMHGPNFSRQNHAGNQAFYDAFKKVDQNPAP